VAAVTRPIRADTTSGSPVSSFAQGSARPATWPPVPVGPTDRLSLGSRLGVQAHSGPHMGGGARSRELTSLHPNIRLTEGTPLPFTRKSMTARAGDRPTRGKVHCEPPVVCEKLNGTRRVLRVERCVTEPSRMNVTWVMLAPSAVPTNSDWPYPTTAGVVPVILVAHPEEVWRRVGSITRSSAAPRRRRYPCGPRPSATARR